MAGLLFPKRDSTHTENLCSGSRLRLFLAADLANLGLGAVGERALVQDLDTGLTARGAMTVTAVYCGPETFSTMGFGHLGFLLNELSPRRGS